ncbi:hypothetical protein IC617_08755 [Neiella sp. HB171785]|uniref:Uncharacterized protein n=1 Tax=Neiella litorisoli TaxID=2771431 RepID=A0A8J6QJX1_9GAMM|nr:hypothetical protein [Neiella litorisoli]MBD1389516.1 hypothetical protein [Neiella litorisoli]
MYLNLTPLNADELPIRQCFDVDQPMRPVLHDILRRAARPNPDVYEVVQDLLALALWVPIHNGKNLLAWPVSHLIVEEGFALLPELVSACSEHSIKVQLYDGQTVNPLVDGHNGATVVRLAG